MTAHTVNVKGSTGQVLSCTIYRAGGKKLLAKGHLVSEEDVRLLQGEGIHEVWVTHLEDGEVSEDEAVMTVASELGCGSLQICLAAGGRANLMATQQACILIDEQLLKEINCTASIAIATVPNFSYLATNQRIATVKSAPFAVSKSQLDGVISTLKEKGPVLQARPIANPTVAVLYSDPVDGDRARHLFESTVNQRLERLGARVTYALTCTENEGAVARSLEQLLRAGPTVILIASTTAPAGPADVIGRSMVRIGCTLERFLAPVEPGNLLLLGYMDEVPLVSAPGCFRSARPNVMDLVLPPMLARYRVSAWEIACLGHGGLLA